MSLDAKAPSFRIKAGLLVPSEVEGSGGRRFRVTADPRRGYLEITANQDEGTLSIGWRTRNAQDTEFSLIIMADSLRVARVATGRDGDRVYSLISKSSSSRRFFWLQEPDADGDEARIRRLRAMLKSPPQAEAPRTAPLPLVLNTSDALDVATGSDEAAERLIRRLPESQRSREQLEAAIRSPQLRQALSALSAALGTENYETVFANFDLDPADGADELAHGDAVGAFLAALRAKVSRADGAGPAGDEGDSAGTDDADEEGDHGEAE